MLSSVSKSEYLDINELVEGNTYTKVGLVSKCKAGTSVLEQGYYTFYVKDINANVVPAHRFNILNFERTGYDASYLEGKPVTITFNATIFNGRWSLILSDIKLFTGAFDYKRFSGFFTIAEDFIQSTYTRFNMNYKVPAQYSNVSIQSMYNGKVGGAAKLLESVVRSSLNLEDSINLADFLFVVKEAFEFYVSYSLSKEEYHVLDAKTFFNLLNVTYRRLENDNRLSAVIDTCYVLTDTGEPHHYFAFIIKNLVETELKNAKLISTVKAMPAGIATTIDNKCILNY